MNSPDTGLVQNPEGDEQGASRGLARGERHTQYDCMHCDYITTGCTCSDVPRL